MVRPRPLVAAALAAAFVALPASPLRAEPGVLTVSGSGAALADVTLAGDLTFDYADAVITGTGRYAGFAVWRVTGGKPQPFGGVLASADLATPGGPATIAATSAHGLLAPVTTGRGRVTLPRGRYRVFLLADDRVEIRVPLAPGSAAVTITPTRPSRQAYAAAARALAAGTSAAVRTPLVGGAATRYEVLARVGAQGGYVEDPRVTACVTSRAASCARGQYAQEARNAGLSPWPTTGALGVRGALLGKAVREARAEAFVTGGVHATVTLVVLAYDLA